MSANEPPPLSACCRAEAERTLRRHRHVAVCDECGSLVLGYGDATDYERTTEELTGRQVAFQVGRVRNLRVIAYRR